MYKIVELVVNPSSQYINMGTLENPNYCLPPIAECAWEHERYPDNCPAEFATKEDAVAWIEKAYAPLADAVYESWQEGRNHTGGAISQLVIVDGNNEPEEFPDSIGVYSTPVYGWS